MFITVEYLFGNIQFMFQVILRIKQCHFKQNRLSIWTWLFVSQCLQLRPFWTAGYKNGFEQYQSGSRSSTLLSDLSSREIQLLRQLQAKCTPLFGGSKRHSHQFLQMRLCYFACQLLLVHSLLNRSGSIMQTGCASNHECRSTLDECQSIPAFGEVS